MSSSEFPSYTHNVSKTTIGFPAEYSSTGGNISAANPQGSVTPIDWIPTNIGMAFTGNVSIGTDTPSSQYKFYTNGNSYFSQNVYVVGILTALKFYGDGSGLTNLTGVGAGIQIKNNGTLVGSSGTVDFFGNVTVSIGAGSGIATVFVANYWETTSVGINTLSNVGIGTTNPTSKLYVSGNQYVTGIATVGSLNVGTAATITTGGLSVSGIVTDSKGNVRQIPRATSSLLTASDAGKFIDSTGGVTINASTGFSVGDAVTIFNNAATTSSITASGITLRQAGTTNTGSRTLGAYALVTVLCVASNTYVVGGSGLT